MKYLSILLMLTITYSCNIKNQLFNNDSEKDAPIIYEDKLLELNKNVSFFINELNTITASEHDEISKETLIDYFNKTRKLKRKSSAYGKAGFSLMILLGEHFLEDKNGYWVLIKSRY